MVRTRRAARGLCSVRTKDVPFSWRMKNVSQCFVNGRSHKIGGNRGTVDMETLVTGNKWRGVNSSKSIKREVFDRSQVPKYENNGHKGYSWLADAPLSSYLGRRVSPLAGAPWGEPEETRRGGL